ncbi:hypothetical protein [Streptomyces albireticuli]|uniref:Pyridoxamine 5'-phosphate oxidase putative domain-containing protein n=1 Tax=Streptomyces albireticuli TaxID=1940 RepID=A0A2A2D6M2_9ACTN|nr:hypothetical protein [Streptomyces albireticuli]MCD9195160.1 hypothetical protein [Streptomyces albireticuli]PAU47029.1 hypothetical protein CK936_20695 [Streptomyces albireticuli]
MSVPLGDQLPRSVLRLFTPSERERPEGQCFLLVTVDADGCPRPCVLSVGDLCPIGDRRLRAAVRPGSRTAANLGSGRPALLTSAAPPDVFHVRLAPARLPDAPGSPLARFEFTVVSVDRDGHEGLPVTRPMWFAAHPERREDVLALWREQHRVLVH